MVCGRRQLVESVIVFFLFCGLSFSGWAQSVVKADQIVVEKEKRTMTLYQNGQVIQSYKIALGDNPKGHKVQQGDERTPEGKYKIDLKNDKSQFHLSLRISYPNVQDRLNAQKLGMDPGGDIFIHGLPPAWRSVGAAHRLQDWTNGCIAVTSEEIEEIWKLVDVGTRVEIRP